MEYLIAVPSGVALMDPTSSQVTLPTRFLVTTAHLICVLSVTFDVVRPHGCIYAMRQCHRRLMPSDVMVLLLCNVLHACKCRCRFMHAACRPAFYTLRSMWCAAQDAVVGQVMMASPDNLAAEPGVTADEFSRQRSQ